LFAAVLSRGELVMAYSRLAATATMEAARGCVVSEEEQTIDAGQKERQIGNNVKKVGNTEKGTIIREFIIRARVGNATI
jgi:hypothetical protein